MRVESIHRTITSLILSSALGLLGCLDLPPPIDRGIDADLDARPTEDLATLAGDTSVHDTELPIDGLLELDQTTDHQLVHIKSGC